MEHRPHPRPAPDAPVPAKAAAVARDRRTVRTAYDRFLVTGSAPTGLDPLVVASWRRSLRSGVDPEHVRTAAAMDAAALDEYRTSHPLADVMPMVRDLVVDGARDDGLVVAVSDDVGRLLWVEGDPRTRTVAERVGFLPGAVWRERDVGTNAPGTALATRRAVQVLGAEHFARPVQALNCAAAPIHGPDGHIVGVLDVTGGRAAGSSVALSLVRAVVAGVERELVRLGTQATAGPPVDVRLLDRPTVRTPRGERRLTGRHAEILALLGEHPNGLSVEELAVLLHPGDLSAVTVRAEVSRLRRAAGPLVVGSRPYRLAPGVRTDVAVVRARLADGDVHGALTTYTGPLLPWSVAPGVERARTELAAEMRSAVLADGDPGALDAWTRTDDGAADHAAWSLLTRRTAPASPLGARARAHLAVLDADLR
ncbi:GAF domain-containing protein [Isoptericola jiangsuensis]|uniref:GAF domain-containing protein n=1 Tax=Isoptericola jiangsuensis TaxID=548579 RepID=UPI003AAA94F6